MTSYPFRKMAAATAEYYFRFRTVDVTAFRRSKSISKPNFVEISQMEDEIYFYGNPKWLGKGSIFFKIKNVSISWDVLLHFVNTKMYF